MTISTTPRFGFKQYSAGTDPHPNRDEFNALVGLIESNAALFSQDVSASRPAAGKAGRYFWDKTVARLYYDDGANWNEVTTNGGGGAAKPVTPGVAGTEGASARSARADHTHNLPLATASVDGAMPASDKALLNTAAAAATPGSLVKLDAAGRAQVAGPSASADIANKSYVDAETAKRALASHDHAASDITSGTFAVARLPLVTVSAAGAMLAADKQKLDAATSAATPNTLVKLDAAGRAQFASPSTAADAATKSYVDGLISGRALTSHTHDFASITGKPATYPADWAGISGVPTIFPTNWANVADIPSTMPSTWATVSGKPATFPSTWATVSGKPTTFAPSAHTHDWAEVTGVPATFAPSAHSHSASDVTSGTFAAARLPIATGATAGAMSPTFVNLLNEATYMPTGDTLVRRHTSGSLRVITGGADEDAANKGYVDSKLAAKLNATAFSDRIGSGATYTQLHSAGLLGALTVYDSGVLQTKNTYGNNVGDSSAYRSVWVDSGGYFGYNLSSEKYKTNIETYSVSLDVLRKIEPKRFQYKSGIEKVGAEKAPWRVNFIAEDLFDAGLTEYVSFEGDVEDREHVQTINEQLMVNALWSFAKQQQDQIEELAKQLAELKAAI
ncbi:minor tail protein [Arthrobacter phage Sicarius2]|uniref:Minor tail protein n=1 Tax=Arthrobacter phage Sicarius2 TaxID=2836090 RepID=A0A8F3E8F4_9CAUD|nr:minor tail protein [Arthrobacter phage Sicarius2]